MTGFDDTDRRQLALLLHEYAEHGSTALARLGLRCLPPVLTRWAR
ncbi:hypothetical protein [Embleya scabrispora]|nr:hypothetical protein [Embleya scabrispora]